MPASIGMVIGGIAMLERDPAFGWLIEAGVVFLMVGALYGLIAARMVAPSRIDDTHVWLKGICPDFLEGLPEWPRSF